MDNEKEGIGTTLNTAMEYGLAMGAFIILKFIITVCATYNLFMNMVAMCLMIITPYIIYRFLLYYARRSQKEITNSQLWSFGTLIFIFATLLAALAQYLFLTYIDPDFFTRQVGILGESLKQLESGSVSPFLENFTIMLKQMVDTMQNTVPASAIDTAINSIWGNVFWGSIFSLIAAPFVKMRLRYNSKTNNFPH